MTPHNELRLLPWSGPDGKPCFLSTDTSDGPVSRLADYTETTQLAVGTELLEHAQKVLIDETSDLEELRLLASDLAGALRDALRVATSRGHRLPATPAHEGDDEGPRLPAAAFC
ncbi:MULTISPECIES: hypothetical protein [unclassified Streptomyces]|uniref:hypothetical protein n=1 Tax=unclassified Streptomyces TaxID=2593676 RepID=UPI0006AF9BF1|nr:MULTISPECIES: hypothetical protein [unclassified Streptomyces]KOX30772.1 hypothetical protein ADL06_11235 [Streptomyces sp. NRRL F-6491]KOX38806.1 hypothetical protein ADL08_26215 [Streptomyces sp. NRRL F-6492]